MSVLLSMRNRKKLSISKLYRIKFKLKLKKKSTFRKGLSISDLCENASLFLRLPKSFENEREEFESLNYIAAFKHKNHYQ